MLFEFRFVEHGDRKIGARQAAPAAPVFHELVATDAKVAGALTVRQVLGRRNVTPRHVLDAAQVLQRQDLSLDLEFQLFRQEQFWQLVVVQPAVPNLERTGAAERSLIERAEERPEDRAFVRRGAAEAGVVIDYDYLYLPMARVMKAYSLMLNAAGRPGPVLVNPADGVLGMSGSTGQLCERSGSALACREATRGRLSRARSAS